MGLFSRKTPETAEQSYIRAAAARQVEIARKRAYAADQEAQKQQMTADVYGRPGTDYHDPGIAAEAVAKRNAALDSRDRHRQDADRQKQIATPPPAKRRWL